MDFMMLGYVLAKLSWDIVKNARMTYMDAFNARIKLGLYPYMSDDRLLALRDAELGSSHPVVLRFFAYVREHVPWTCDVPVKGENPVKSEDPSAALLPPPAAVYEDLRQILMS
jgi:hypothetical protein